MFQLGYIVQNLSIIKLPNTMGWHNADAPWPFISKVEAVGHLNYEQKGDPNAQIKSFIISTVYVTKFVPVGLHCAEFIKYQATQYDGTIQTPHDHLFLKLRQWVISIMSKKVNQMLKIKVLSYLRNQIRSSWANMCRIH